jgi:hypothetical protein
LTFAVHEEAEHGLAFSSFGYRSFVALRIG